MSRTLRPTWSPKVRCRTFTAQILGLSPDRSVGALKQYLYQAEALPSPEIKLDLIMVEDCAHLSEMVAQEGFPLMRGEWPRTVRYVQVQRHWFYAFLSMLPLLVLFGGEGQLWDVFPWK